LHLGYSDVVSVFLNGRLVFAGDSSYQSRDPSFLGVVGFFDTVALPLRKGQNEVLISLAEIAGGWGFMARDGEAIQQAPGMRKVWETSRQFRVPESAAFDPDSGAVFVSNYDGYNRSAAEGKQSISKLMMDGRVETLDWVTGLRNPTGLTVNKGKLWAVETGGIVEIDIKAANILARHAVPGAAGLNDIAGDSSGTLFVSDFRKSVIFRFGAGRSEEWLAGPEVSRPNGVWVDGGKLYWGNNGDGTLKSADLETKTVTVIARFGQGILDGISGDGKGNILISHNEGRLYQVTPAGEVAVILDTSVRGDRIADFTFIPEKRLLIIPGFTGSRVSAWKVGDVP
jgi:sugar lactone lactonase YvrE